MSESMRIRWCDQARGIGIFLVVIGHCFITLGKVTSVNYAIYSFHMPLFFILSGFVLKDNSSYRQFVIKRFRQIMIPAYLFAGTYTIAKKVIDFLILRKSITEFDIDICNVIKHILFFRDTSWSGWWFLPTLYVALLIVRAIIRIRGAIVRSLIVVTVFSFGIVYNAVLNMPLPFSAEIVPLAVLFVYMGYYLKNVYDKLCDCTFDVHRIYTPLFIVISFTWVICVCLIYKNKYHQNMWCYDITNVPLFILSGFCGTIMLCVLCMRMHGSYHIEKMGKISLHIFGIHYIFIYMIKLLVTAHPRIAGCNWISSFLLANIYAIGIIFICFELCVIRERMTEWLRKKNE